MPSGASVAALAAFRQAGRADMPVTKTVNKEAMRALDGVVAMGRVEGKVGWFDSARYSNGVPVALVAAVNEFGWPEHNIPPRLGMRATAEASKGPWQNVSATAAKRVAKGTLSPFEAMDLITQVAAGDVRKHITEVRSPPLAVNTVKARLAGKKQGRVVSISISKPLVASGLLLNTLTGKAENK